MARGSQQRWQQPVMWCRHALPLTLQLGWRLSELQAAPFQPAARVPCSAVHVIVALVLLVGSAGGQMETGAELLGRVVIMEKELEAKLREATPKVQDTAQGGDTSSPGVGGAKGEKGEKTLMIAKVGEAEEEDAAKVRARDPRSEVPSKPHYDALSEMRKSYRAIGTPFESGIAAITSHPDDIMREGKEHYRLNELDLCYEAATSLPTCPEFGSCNAKRRGSPKDAPALSVEACVSRVYEQLTPPTAPCLEPPPPSTTTTPDPGTTPAPACPPDPVLLIFRLRDVCVNKRGVTFNDSVVFSRAGCVIDDADQPVLAPPGKVIQVNRAISVLYLNGYNFYHMLNEVLPVFLQLAPFLQREPSIPILMRCSQWLYYLHVGVPLVGIRGEDLNVVCMEDAGEIMRVHDAIQPIFAACGRPSLDMTELRRRFYLPRNGLPYFRPGWVLRDRTPMTPSEMARLPDDWLVVLARRRGDRRSIEGAAELYRGIQDLFGQDRVGEYFGDLHLVEAKRLFNRVAVYVAAHGAGLTNMVFMPSGSFVLEIRPRDLNNIVYREMAKGCALRFHLVFGLGNMSSHLVPNIPAVLQELRGIKEELQVKLAAQKQ